MNYDKRKVQVLKRLDKIGCDAGMTELKIKHSTGKVEIIKMSTESANDFCTFNKMNNL